MNKVHTLYEILSLLQSLSLQFLDLRLSFGLEEEDAELLDERVEGAGEVCAAKGDGDDCYDQRGDERGVDHF